jgi:hypothetical protein
MWCLSANNIEWITVPCCLLCLIQNSNRKDLYLIWVFLDLFFKPVIVHLLL